MSILQLQAKDTVVRINDTDAVNCVQSFNWDSAMNAEQLSQLGDANYDAQTIQPEVTAQFEVRATGALSTLLSRMVYSYDVDGEFVPPSASNTKVIHEVDMERAVFDLIEAKKANEVFDRSTLIPRAHLRSFSVSARSDGNATESFTAEADLLEIYRKPLHDLRSVPVVRDVAGTPETTVIVPTTYTVESHATIAGAAWKIQALDIDGVRVAAADLDVTSDPGGDIVTLGTAAQAAGVTIPIGARTHLIIYKKTPGAFPSIVYPTSARFVKADHINLWLVDTAATFSFTAGANTYTAQTVAQILAQNGGVDFNAIPFSAADLFLRVQSAEMTVDLQREALREIRKNDRGNSIYYRAARFPLNVSCQMSAFETDLNDWAKVQGKNLMGSATPDILDLAGFENKTWMVVMRYYKGNTAIQTIGLLNARVDGAGQRVSVGGRAEQTWNMTGSEVVVQGANV
jgi:hypothetical protein